MRFSKEYKLFSPSGMEVTLLNAGAAITGIRMADRNGTFANVALPLKAINDPSCAGVTLAPYAGRIAKGRLEIDGNIHQLTLNEGNNQIHGGRETLAHKLWKCEGRFDAAQYQEISFSATAKAGTDGFPGNRRFTVTYRLWHNQQLEILLTAVTDAPTRVNLSNHAYFNLSGDFSKVINEHHLQINADELYVNDEAFLMNGRTTPMPELDFRHMRYIGAPGGHTQLERAKGINHCYILGNKKEAAVLLDSSSGRRMRLYTDQPCLMVYSGGYLDMPNCAIAMEAQEHPESPFAPKGKTLYPGDIYQRRIVYHFDTLPE